MHESTVPSRKTSLLCNQQSTRTKCTKHFCHIFSNACSCSLSTKANWHEPNELYPVIDVTMLVVAIPKSYVHEWVWELEQKRILRASLNFTITFSPPSPSACIALTSSVPYSFFYETVKDDAQI